MDNRQIEQKLRQDIIETTPDMLDDLMTELAIDETQPVSVPVSKPVISRRRNIRRAVSALAAVFVLGIGVFTMMNRQPAVVAVVGFDVNPSVELSVDKQERVVDVTALNDEGEEILADLDLAGVDADVASYAVVGAMVSRGYLTPTSNSILVSVRADDPERGRRIEEELSASLSSYFADSKIDIAILGQIVEVDDELEAFAESHHISLGKAWLIRQLLAGDGTTANGMKMTEESLLKLSTQQLVFLAEGRGINGQTAYGKPDASGYVSEEQAVKTALGHYGFSRSDVKRLSVDMDCDDGAIIYEVDFVKGSMEYEVDVDATSGKVRFAEKESVDRDDRNDRDDRDDDDRYDDDDDRHEVDRDDDDDDDRDDDDDDDDDRDDDDDDD